MDKKNQLEQINAAFDTMFDDACAEDSRYAAFFPEDCHGIIFDAENSKSFPCTLRLEFTGRVEDYIINVEQHSASVCYVVATLLGTSSNDICYNLVSPRVWDEFVRQLETKTYYNGIDQALDDCLDRVFGEDYERVIEDPNGEVKVFFSLADVFSWCMIHHVSIIGGRN